MVLLSIHRYGDFALHRQNGTCLPLKVCKHRRFCTVPSLQVCFRNLAPCKDLTALRAACAVYIPLCASFFTKVKLYTLLHRKCPVQTLMTQLYRKTEKGNCIVPPAKRMCKQSAQIYKSEKKSGQTIRCVCLLDMNQNPGKYLSH